MTISVEYVPAEHLDQFWPVAEPMLKRVEEQIGARMGVADIYARLRSGAETLWFIAQNGDIVAAATTSIAFYPRRKCLVIENVAGRQMDEWGDDVIAEFKRIGIASELDGIEAHGRLGWKKYHQRNGFRIRDVIYEMEF